MRSFAVIAAVIVGVVALFALKLIGLILKYAFVIALILTLAAWIGFRGLEKKIGSRSGPN
jgi:hypothetical protein